MRRVRHVFAWLGGIVFIAVCAVIVAALVYRATVVSRLAPQIFMTRSSSTGTPETYGAPYRIIKIHSHDRILQAWAVDAGVGAPAILLFPGNGQTIHDLAQVQAYLFHQGVSSMDFDYSGVGASTGKPTVRNLNQDAKAAWRTFAKWTGSGHPKFVFGYSLGTGVALHNASAFTPAPRGIIVYGAFSSAKSLIGYIAPGIPKVLVALMPDVWDNVEAAERLRQPLLVVAGMNDVNVPPINGRQIALFAHDGGDFVLIPGAGHGGIVSSNATTFDAVWKPILAFVQKHSEGGPPASQATLGLPTHTQMPTSAPASTTGR
ncbi:MAG: alpha/beta hydrolase [Rhodanobacteraceae bacterium]